MSLTRLIETHSQTFSSPFKSHTMWIHGKGKYSENQIDSSFIPLHKKKKLKHLKTNKKNKSQFNECNEPTIV